MFNLLIDWYKDKHNIELSNLPSSIESELHLRSLESKVLAPIQKKYGTINITYGFISPELNRFIQKHSPSGTAPQLDQHASHELNLQGNRINNRNGAACDFFVEGYENKMNYIVVFLCQFLEFDKIYYYGKNRPIHVSISNNPKKHLQVMNLSKNGRRIPGKRAYAESALKLAMELNT
jgi:hypothetical protein